MNSRLSPEYVLLGFLYKQPGYGYELNKRLSDEFGYIWRVSQSQTYNILNRLALHGFITSTEVEQEKLPARQMLHITESGMRRFNTWLNSPTRCSVHAIRVEFISRLYFFQLYYPQKTQEMIHVQLEVVRKGLIRLNELRSTLADHQILNRLALDLRIQMLTSVIGWLDECRKASVPTNI